MQTDRLTILLGLLEKQPDDPFLLYAIAIEYEAKGQEEKALKLYQQLLSERPDYLPVYYQFGQLMARFGEGKQALSILEKGMQLAKELNDNKTFRELKEAYQWIEDEL